MEEQRATNPTEEKTCTDLADNDLQFRGTDLPKINAAHDQRILTMVLSKNAAHLMDGTYQQLGGV